MKRTLLFLHVSAFLILAGSVAACRAQESESTKSTLKTVGNEEVEAKRRDGANDGIDGSRRNAITTAVENVAPAVVGINVTEVREVRYRDPWESMFQNDPYFQQYQHLIPRRGSQVYRQELHGLGSGFIISSDGYIITNDHVAGAATKVIVTTTDGKQHEARIIGSDPASDVALLKIDGEKFPYLEIGNSDDVIVGEWAIALGNPFGLFDINAKPTVTVGVISNTGVTLRPEDQRAYIDMVQTDAAISSGNSGGPLVNAVGEVIAMNTIIYSTSQSNRGAGSIGIGFAVPINRVMKIVEDLKKNGKIDRDFWTGMSVRPIDANIARYLGLETTDGAVIVEIAPRSPAAASDLQVGDVIVELNGRPVRSDEDVVLVVNDSRVGDEMKMKVVRKNETLSKTMKLTKRN